jgi:hypothetical protein
MRALLIAPAVMACCTAWAGEVYKYRMPDGKILYTTEVSTTGRLLEILPEPAPRPQVIEAERQAKLKREQESGGNALAKRLATLDAVDAEIKAALRALETAKAAAEAAAEPLPGERRGTVSGKSRLTEEYWLRQRELRQAVEAARQRLDAAYAARDAIR